MLLTTKCWNHKSDSLVAIQFFLCRKQGNVLQHCIYIRRETATNTSWKWIGKCFMKIKCKILSFFQKKKLEKMGNIILWSWSWNLSFFFFAFLSYCLRLSNNFSKLHPVYSDRQTFFMDSLFITITHIHTSTSYAIKTRFIYSTLILKNLNVKTIRLAILM